MMPSTFPGVASRPSSAVKSPAPARWQIEESPVRDGRVNAVLANRLGRARKPPSASVTELRRSSASDGGRQGAAGATGAGRRTVWRWVWPRGGQGLNGTL